MIEKGFEQIDENKWKKACEHVVNVIEPKFWKCDAIREEIPKFVINISDSDTESEGETDSSSDGDETEDYDWN